MGVSKGVYKFDSLNEISKTLHIQLAKSSCAYLENRLFPLIHFAIMFSQYKQLLNKNMVRELKTEIKKIKDQKYYKLQTRRLFSSYSELKKRVGKRDTQRIMLFSSYCLLKNFKIYSYMSAICYKWFWK